MSTRFRKPRGGAAVETAVAMIVLVPLIMYTLFLEDLLFYKFDLQETVTSTPWDYADLDYREDKTSIDDQRSTARTAAMQTFWDHTSAWNTYSDPNHDAKDTDHHQALAAHECWLAQGGQEIECSNSSSVGITVAGEFIALNKGGKVSCNAILGVQNYFLPQQLFQWWAKAAMTKQKRWVGESADGAIHDNAKQDPYLYPKLEFSVLTDSWALNSMDNESLLNPDAHPANLGHKFTKWVAIPYGLRQGQLQKAKDFASQAQNDELLGSMATIDGTGDMLDTPPVAWKADAKREFHDHTTSGWSDSRHSGTQGSMQDKYLGQADSKW